MKGILFALLLITSVTFGQGHAVSNVKYIPKLQTSFITGSICFVDRQSDITTISHVANELIFRQRCITAGGVSGYARFNNVSTINNVTRGIVTVTENGTSGAVGSWTAAEVKHAGITIYHTDPDNNYILMISPAASTAGDRSLQLVKQVSGTETMLQAIVVPGISLNVPYELRLWRTAGVLTGELYNMAGTLLGTVGASDTSLSTGVSGVHGFSCDYTAQISIQ